MYVLVIEVLVEVDERKRTRIQGWVVGSKSDMNTISIRRCNSDTHSISNETGLVPTHKHSQSTLTQYTNNPEVL